MYSKITHFYPLEFCIFDVENLFLEALQLTFREQFFKKANVVLSIDLLIDGQISSFFPYQHWGHLFTLIMVQKFTQSFENFKKIPF